MREKLQAIDGREYQIMWSLAGLVAVLLAGYVYFVQVSISNINDRRIAEERISEIESRLAALEPEYMSLSQSRVNLAFARELGFKEVKDSTYVARKADTVSLSMLSNEI